MKESDSLLSENVCWLVITVVKKIKKTNINLCVNEAVHSNSAHVSYKSKHYIIICCNLFQIALTYSNSSDFL